MLDLPGTWSALCGVVFLLGMRHGLDADHLAAIDGMTRLSHGGHDGSFRYCGALFSLGHGGIVVLVAGTVASLSGRWAVPGWVDATGAWVSVVFLLALGLANLRMALRPAPGAAVVGFKAALFGRAVTARTPWAAAAVGALFALSFDTLSQAALFAITAGRFGGIARAVVLAGLFMLGMLLVDGLNGLWVAHLISRADAFAARAARSMAFVVAVVSLIVGSWGAARLLLPGADRWTTGKELFVAAGVVLALAVCFLGARSWKGAGRLSGRA